MQNGGEMWGGQDRDGGNRGNQGLPEHLWNFYLINVDMVLDLCGVLSSNFF